MDQMIMQCLVFIMIKSCKQLNYPLGITLTRKRIRGIHMMGGDFEKHFRVPFMIIIIVITRVED